MTLPLTFTVEEAMVFAKQDCLEEWVHLFLKTIGGNVPFSEGLKRERRNWAGPLLLPLHELERCCGPEPEMEFYTPAESWDAHVGELITSLREGWSSPPLIVQVIEEGRLSIRDGNHRHKALRRLGEPAAWVILWNTDGETDLGAWTGAR
ncbi:ParB N-terminal domain-containing protein [Paenibacillus rhizovicinus]|uniref:ParB N-terminal domain-containing protein n=1 Tax=Paenibacillus rhizovicinus TaxID=2704463 RepID=A0A6C0P5A3_9BACL|nr:ParB/Srx family N-terminal domain-containing protein [Paenibacillus rhizovicinus]QHW33720.1 ParB N-terminal domain-containing protein [Paenibacillus rhizovicinus]